jgi:hypothetical protein
MMTAARVNRRFMAPPLAALMFIGTPPPESVAIVSRAPANVKPGSTYDDLGVSPYVGVWIEDDLAGSSQPAERSPNLLPAACCPLSSDSYRAVF